MPTNPYTEIAETIKELARKVDTFISTAPATYINRTEFDQRTQGLENRYKELKEELVTLKESQRDDLRWNNEEHKGLAESVGESERRILDKIDETTQTSWGHRLTMLLAGFGWVITLGLVIMDLLAKH